MTKSLFYLEHEQRERELTTRTAERKATGTKEKPAHVSRTPSPTVEGIIKS